MGQNLLKDTPKEEATAGQTLGNLSLGPDPFLPRPFSPGYLHREEEELRYDKLGTDSFLSPASNAEAEIATWQLANQKARACYCFDFSQAVPGRRAYRLEEAEVVLICY